MEERTKINSKLEIDTTKKIELSWLWIVVIFALGVIVGAWLW